MPKLDDVAQQIPLTSTEAEIELLEEAKEQGYSSVEEYLEDKTH